MPKDNWLDTLKSVQLTPEDAAQRENQAYTRKSTNLALNLDDEAADDEDEWTYASEVFGQKVEVVHPIQLRSDKGVERSLLSKFDLTQCYRLQLALKSPVVKVDTVHVLLEIFPVQIANGMVKGSHVMTILGFDNYFWSNDTGCAVFDVYMHDGSLSLKGYTGNYGGRRGLTPLHPHYPLHIIDTPEWIWTHEKPYRKPTEP